MPGSTLRYALLATSIAAIPLAARATPPTQSTPDYSGQTAPFSGQQAEPGFATGLFGASRGNLLGDAFGVRTLLGRYGMSLDVIETSELFGNATGGVNRGVAYTGLTTATLQLDTQRAFGWAGRHVQRQRAADPRPQPRGRQPANLQTASGIEAEPATRAVGALVPAVVARRPARCEGRAAEPRPGVHRQRRLRAVHQHHDGLAAAAFGRSLCRRPGLSAVLARRPAARAADGRPFTVLAGVFDDNPPGGPFDDDSQVRGGEQSGTRISTLSTGALFIARGAVCAEPAVARARWTPATRRPACPASTSSAPGTTRRASPTSGSTTPACRWPTPPATASAQRKRGNYSIYGVFDQTIWRPDPDEPPRDRHLRAHDGRAGRPQPDRFQRQCRRHLEGAVPRPRQRHVRASASASPRSAAQRHRSSIAAPTASAARPGPLQRKLRRSHLPVPGDALVVRCSPTSSTCSRPAAASPIRNCRASASATRPSSACAPRHVLISAIEIRRVQ